MSTHNAARRKIVLRQGAERTDVLIAADLPIGMSLQGVDVNLLNPAIIALDSLGRKVDMSIPPGSSFEDGAVITFVDLNRPVEAAPAGVETDIGIRRSARPRIAWSMAFIAIGLLAITAMLVLVDGSFEVANSIRWTLPEWVRFAVGLLLILIALAASIVDGMRGNKVMSFRAQRGFQGAGLRAWSIFAAPLLAASATTLMIPLVAAARSHLMIFVSLLMATIVATLGYVVRRPGQSRQAAGLLAAMLGVATCAFGATLAAAWPSTVAAAVLVGLVPPVMKALPNWCVRVADAQLIDVSLTMTLRWTVRGPVISEPESIELDDIADLVERSEFARDIGNITLALVPPLLLPWILTSVTYGSISWWGAIVLAASVVVAFLYLPRSVRRPVSRWAPRVGAAAVLAELSVGVVGSFNSLSVVSAIVVLALAILIGALVTPIARGYRALGPSRFADAGEWIAVILALPAGLVAADLIEILRAVTSG